MKIANFLKFRVLRNTILIGMMAYVCSCKPDTPEYKIVIAVDYDSVVKDYIDDSVVLSNLVSGSQSSYDDYSVQLVERFVIANPGKPLSGLFTKSTYFQGLTKSKDYVDKLKELLLEQSNTFAEELKYELTKSRLNFTSVEENGSISVTLHNLKDSSAIQALFNKQASKKILFMRGYESNTLIHRISNINTQKSRETAARNQKENKSLAEMTKDNPDDLNSMFELITVDMQNCYVGVAKNTDTAKVSKLLKEQYFPDAEALNIELLWGDNFASKDYTKSMLYAVSTSGYPVIDNRDVYTVGLDGSSGDAMPSMAIQLTDEGATKFEYLSANSIGQQIAIVIDNRVVTAPTVNSTITGGRISMTGNMNKNEILQMSSQIRPSRYSTPFKIISFKKVQ